MGLLGKLIKTGIVAGAAVAAVKVSEKYNEINPENTGTANEKKAAFKEAAGEVYQQAAATVQQKAPGVVESIKEKVPGVAETIDAIKEKAPAVMESIKEKAPGVAEAIDAIKEKAPGVVEQFKQNAQTFADVVSGQEVSDADFTPVEEENTEKKEE